MFITYEEFDGDYIVPLDDNEIKVDGSGSVKIKIHDVTMKMVGEVKHMSKLESNLVSFGWLDSCGYSCSAKDGVMKVGHCPLVGMKGKLMHNNLYKLIGSVIHGGACNEVLDKVYKK